MDQQADAVVGAFAAAKEAAVEAELEYVIGHLRSNSQLLFNLSALMKSDALKALLEGRYAADETAKSAEDSDKPKACRKLRASTKRWRHLATQPHIVIDLAVSLFGSREFAIG